MNEKVASFQLLHRNLSFLNFLKGYTVTVTWLNGYMVTVVNDYKVTGVGYTVTWLYGYMNTLLHGYTIRLVT